MRFAKISLIMMGLAVVGNGLCSALEMQVNRSLDGLRDVLCRDFLNHFTQIDPDRIAVNRLAAVGTRQF